MVRLKDINDDMAKRGMLTFQFLMVRLKVKIKTAKI